jgi:hypothetical protein
MYKYFSFIFLAVFCGSSTSFAQNCQREYDFSKLNLKIYSDPQLAGPVEKIIASDLSQAVIDAKQTASSKQAAYDLAIKQAEELEQLAFKAKEQSEYLSSPDGIDWWGMVRSTSLQEDFKCGGAASSSLCQAQTYWWFALISRQTAEGIRCLWGTPAGKAGSGHSKNVSPTSRANQPAIENGQAMAKAAEAAADSQAVREANTAAANAAKAQMDQIVADKGQAEAARLEYEAQMAANQAARAKYEKAKAAADAARRRYEQKRAAWLAAQKRP